MTVKVKPLEWSGKFAHGSGVMYSFDQDHDCVILCVTEGAMTIKSVYSNLESAKASAQADYERRILSAIETAPPSVAEAARVLLNTPGALTAIDVLVHDQGHNVPDAISLMAYDPDTLSALTVESQT